MPYTLWSHGRLLGHTDLDVPHFQEHLRHGFVAPTPLGEKLLVDASGVFRICSDRSRKSFASVDAYLDAFTRAVEAREAQELMLRDENGNAFECDFIRVYGTADYDAYDADDCHDSPAGWSESLDEEEDCDPIEGLDEQWDWNSDVASEPEDIRWTTMPYFIQVFLKRPDSDFECADADAEGGLTTG